MSLAKNTIKKYMFADNGVVSWNRLEKVENFKSGIHLLLESVGQDIIAQRLLHMSVTGLCIFRLCIY